jgi:transposase
MSGPGEYVPDPTEGVTRVEDLPQPSIERRSRCKPHSTCPKCGYRRAFCNKRRTRRLHDIGDVVHGRPREIELEVAGYSCTRCGAFFDADTSDIAPKGSHYTHRVIDRAVRSVVEDGLPYRGASWRMWRDHRVFVPFATIQNWVEASGEKSARARTG